MIQTVQKILVVLQIQSIDKVVDVYCETNLQAPLIQKVQKSVEVYQILK